VYVWRGVTDDRADRLGSSAAYTSSTGRVYSADVGFSGGVARTAADAVSGTADATPFRSYRVAVGGAAFSCAIPISDGPRTVYLRFVEPVLDRQPAKRVLSVSAEGQPLLAGLDIYAAAGGKDVAMEKSFPVTVSGGVLNLSFTSSVDNALVAAIVTVTSGRGTATVHRGSGRPIGVGVGA
jgi:trimeric autotransporter adhesin